MFFGFGFLDVRLDFLVDVAVLTDLGLDGMWAASFLS